MTKDWKKKIDDEERARKVEQEKREEEEKEEEQKAKDALRIKKEKEKKDAEFLHQKLIHELGVKFKCHICGTQAKEPSEECVDSGRDDTFNDGTGGWEGGRDAVYADDWSKPADLWQCSKCEQWTCKDHLYKKICKECAEKM